MIRSLRTAVRVPGEAPFDTAHVTVYYPAKPTGSDAERLSGVIPADTEGAPYPVVLFLPGVNVPSTSYRWLAERVVDGGAVFVTFDLVGSLFGGVVGLTPGLDLTAVMPDGYGTKSPGTAIRPVLDELHRLAGDGVLAGTLDLDRVFLGGHSAGGTVALESASPDWYPEIAGVFVYGAHTMVAAALGWDEGTVLTSPADCPVLVVVGELDGIMAASKDRYGGGDGHDPVTRTFREALPPGHEHRLEVLAGASHMAVVHPEDPTTARGFLDTPSGQDEAGRATFGDLVIDFIRSTTPTPEEIPA